MEKPSSVNPDLSKLLQETLTSILGICKQGNADTQDVGVRKDVVRAPSIANQPDPALVAKWIEFENARESSDVHVYVDAENLLKTTSATLDLSWPPRATGDDVASLAMFICKDWLAEGSENHAVGDDAASVVVTWSVYTKRSLSGRSVFVAAGSGAVPGDGDETDDILCVSAAIARARKGDSRVCLVSGDEMRWISLCDDAIRTSWDRVDRGPRLMPSEGNRLVPHILGALKSRCNGDRSSFLSCAARSLHDTRSAPSEPPVPMQTFPSTTDAVSYPSRGARPSVFGDVSATAIVLTASLFTLALSQTL